MAALNSRSVKAFQQKVLRFYARNPRPFPWRKSKNPYHILVSEIMLQQTQTSRVLDYYLRFIKTFPSPKSLATAPLSTVLTQWSGLGYNRRAKFLHRAANQIVMEHAGKVPADIAALEKLPGIGHYTARAVAAFAFDIPSAFIETNIRAVFIKHFFSDQAKVADADILPLVEQTLPHTNVRDWYHALMDYGVFLKAHNPELTQRAKGYVKQKAFAGSVRQMRGAILRYFMQSKKPASKQNLKKQFPPPDHDRFDQALRGLIAEGFIVQKKRLLQLS